MNLHRMFVMVVLSAVLVIGGSLGVAAQTVGELTATLLVSGLEGGSGSTIGPDGALYVGENAAGRIARVDPETGEVTVFASGFPQRLIHTGGIMDIAFVEDTAYALVTLVGEAVGGEDISGIYRIDGEDSFTLIADIGEFSVANPPDTEFFVPEGLQYAMEVVGDSFLVTDGHHNRVLQITLDGQISELIAFDNIVPTGLEVSTETNTVYMTEAGALPHLPEDGKVIALDPDAATTTEVASGVSLPVDIEYGCCGVLYVLGQGEFEEGNPDGAPARPNTGSLVAVNEDGTFSVLMEELNLPTSLEFIGSTAYIVTLDGEIWQIDDLSS